MAIVSEAFSPFLAESGPNDRREAIVIYKTLDSAEALRSKRQKRMSHAQKKRYLKQLAEIQAPVQQLSLNRYRKAGKTRLPKRDKADLVTETSGPVEGAMPFAYVQVTRRTLTALRKSDRRRSGCFPERLEPWRRRWRASTGRISMGMPASLARLTQSTS